MHTGRYLNGGTRYQLEPSRKYQGRGDKEVRRGRLNRALRRLLVVFSPTCSSYGASMSRRMESTCRSPMSV